MLRSNLRNQRKPKKQRSNKLNQKLRKRRRRRKKKRRLRLKKTRRQKLRLSLKLLTRMVMPLKIKKRRRLIKKKLRRMMKPQRNNHHKIIVKSCKKMRPSRAKMSMPNWRNLRRKEKRQPTRSEMKVYIIKIKSKLKVVKSISRLRHQVRPMQLLKKGPLLSRAKKNLKKCKRN